MSLDKEHIGAQVSFLLVLGSNACLRKRLPDLPEGGYTLFLDKADTGLASDEEIVLNLCGEGWFAEGKLLSRQAAVVYFTKRKEKLLLLLSAKIEILKPAEKIFMKPGESIQIGNAYINQVFYEFSSLIKAVHAQIICKEQSGLFLITEQENVYVNEKAVKGEKKLCTGDRVDIYGLHLLILKKLIVCSVFCGVVRIAGSSLQLLKTGKPESKIKENNFIERICG